jgi:hypothetical protein
MTNQSSGRKLPGRSLLMTYRRAVHACGSCQRRAAVATCRRCRAPLCVAHVPFAGERCGTCEESYREAYARMWPSLWHLAGFAAAAPLAWLLRAPLANLWQGKLLAWGGLTSSLAFVDAAVILIGGGSMLGWLFWRLRLQLARRLFLSER